MTGGSLASMQAAERLVHQAHRRRAGQRAVEGQRVAMGASASDVLCMFFGIAPHRVGDTIRWPGQHWMERLASAR